MTRATRTACDVYHAEAALAGGNGVCDKISSGEPYPRIVAGTKTDFNTDDRRQGEHLTAQAVNEVSHSQDLAAHEFCRRLHQGTPVTRYRGLSALRIALVVVLGLCIWNAATAKAADIEYLMVPSAAMGRDVPVAFQAGGPHAVYLLDAFDAAPDVSNWVTAGNAMKTLAGKGISVAAPAGGAWSMYTDWEQDGSRQWDTFLSQELPDWLAANKGLALSGNGVVGASQGGYGALALAAFHPDRFRYAGSMSGFLDPSYTTFNGAITAGLAQFGGVDTRNMWGLPQLGRWKWRDPDVHAQLLVDNSTRLWVYSPGTLTCSDPAAMIGYCDQAQGSNRTFYNQYRAAGGHNGHFDIPTSGQHDWSSWGPQLAAMSSDLVATIK